MMKEFTGLQGSLDGGTNEFWKAGGRCDPTFGAHPNCKEFSIEDAKMVKAYLQDPMQFNLYNPESLLQALFIVNVVFLMLCGCEEHYHMKHSNYSFSIYEASHEFSGQQFIQAMTDYYKICALQCVSYVLVP